MARDRWSSRTTFILGAVGSAVGLGNLWRFPFLTFRWGGGTFLIPYALCLIFFGVPLLLMEITLGRQFQGGDPVCFASMHPRLVGIGWMSAYGSFILSTYYHVLIGWIVIFFFNSFQKTLPWALDRSGNVTGVDRLGGAINFFVVDVLQDSGAIDVQETVNPLVILATTFVWVCSYFSIFKGVAVVSQVVKFSVPVPLLTLAILLFNSVGKEGAADGIKAYIGSWDFDVLSTPQIWQDAVGQVFFSIGVTFGIMTAYSSYRETRKGLLSDSLMIAFADTSVSFFAGFTVFTAVGVLANDLGVTFADESFRSLIGGSKLVFIAYPAALDGLATAPQFFSALFFLTTFLLAIDSAFSIVEAVIAAFYDTNAGRAIPRWKLTLVICVAGYIFGLFFTLDNGGYWLDLVDFYLNSFIMIGVGALECVASMWVYGMEDSMKELGKVPILIYSIFFFLSVVVCTLSLLLLEEHKIIVAFFGWFIVWALGFFLAFLSSPPSPRKVYKLLFSGGASKLMNVMAIDEFDHAELVSFPYKVTIHIWGFCTKYLIPAFLVMLLVTGANANYEKPIAGFAPVYQNIGTFEVLIAYGIFFLFIFIKIDVYSDRVAEHQEKMARREIELAEKNQARLVADGEPVEAPVSVALDAEVKQVSV